MGRLRRTRHVSRQQIARKQEVHAGQACYRQLTAAGAACAQPRPGSTQTSCMGIDHHSARACAWLTQTRCMNSHHPEGRPPDQLAPQPAKQPAQPGRAPPEPPQQGWRAWAALPAEQGSRHAARQAAGGWGLAGWEVTAAAEGLEHEICQQRPGHSRDAQAEGCQLTVQAGAPTLHMVRRVVSCADGNASEHDSTGTACCCSCRVPFAACTAEVHDASPGQGRPSRVQGRPSR